MEINKKPIALQSVGRDPIRQSINSNDNVVANQRSSSEPARDHFSGSMFINDIWKKVLRNSQAEKRYLIGSMIKEEEDSEISRELSYFSNISDDIQKLLQSNGNSFLHARKNSEGSNGFQNNTGEKPLDLYLINSLKLDKLRNEKYIDDQNTGNVNGNSNVKLKNGKENEEELKKMEPKVEYVKNVNLKSNTFYNKNVLNFISKNFPINNSVVRMISGQSKEKNGNNAVSPIDDEYSSNKAKNAKHMARDQQGSRLLQKWISQNNQKIIDEIFSNIKCDFVELMIDPFGNYLCQKILELINQDDANFVASKIASRIVLISHNQHGTRSVQKLVEIIKNKKMIALLGESLKGDVINLSKDVNGNHVIQKCLQYWSPNENQFIFESIMIKCVDLCCNEIGCRVIQRCLEKGTSSQKLDLITLIVGNAIPLITNQFANYVILRILEIKDKDMNPFKKDIVDIVGDVDDILPFIRQKFASKVIEKCLELKEINFEEKVIAVLLDDKLLPSLISDQYANYVVQSALNTCTDPNKERLLQKIMQNAKIIRSNEFGNMIYQKLSTTFTILNFSDLSFLNKGVSFKKDNEQQSSLHQIKKNNFKKNFNI